VCGTICGPMLGTYDANSNDSDDGKHEPNTAVMELECLGNVKKVPDNVSVLATLRKI